MKRETNFLDAIAKYEDVKFPLWDYIDLSKEMSLDHRVKRTIDQLEWVISVLKNAQERISDKLSIKKLEKCLKLAKMGREIVL